MKGNKYTKTGLWMVHITNKINSGLQAHFMSNIGRNVTNNGVNQQVNDKITT